VDLVKPFRYRPACSAAHCALPALYKLAASWSDGSSRELKNYGLACESHRDSQLEIARRHHQALRLCADETVGPVEVYVLRIGCRDAELVRCANKHGGEAGSAGGEAGAGP
jgi:hypothetical protein